MDTTFLGRLAAGCVAVSAILIVIIVCSPMNPSRAADPATKADKSVDQIHNVYAPLESVQAFRCDGKFP